MGFPFVHRAAFVSIDGKRILAIEGTAPLSREKLTDLRTTLSWAEVDVVRLLRRIPMDSRHNSKVNYPELIRHLK